ncbi:diguanylate cyclase regulator RdcB family protein [Franconibacter pulveris]|uniref:diguanylate cyclase regulator RdcB family protein n=1 Tax=Franconibacter pulveris TaxID=435910 RepID=UPI0004951C88|nr:diguanylate cyclase regulator RdcB family protein [Franconibacter pulveris]
MSSLLMEGPGRHVSCLGIKLMVDLAKGIHQTRPSRLAPHQQTIRERLTEELMHKAPLRQWAASGSLMHNDVRLLQWLDQLAGLLSPGHLAISLVADRLSKLQAQAGNDAGLRAQLETLSTQFQQRMTRLETQRQKRDLTTEAHQHCEQVLERWRGGRYNAWSPAGRCYVALEELRWGVFGEAVRLGTADESETLLARLRQLASEQLADSVNASAGTRHFYHHWLTTPPAPGLMDYKDTLSWLGDWSDSERQPVAWSVTQTWQSVALGMPRLCSATRLARAMVDEVFMA